MQQQLNPAKDARQQQLIDATIDCIYKHGLHQTTLAKVTAQANLSIGTVNFYFGSKQQLLLGTLAFVCNEFRQHLVSAITADISAAEALKKVIAIHFDPFLCSPQKIAVWHAFSNVGRNRKEYERICGQLDAEIRSLLLAKISSLCEQTAAKQYDPKALARGFEGLLDGFWQDYLYQPNTFDLEQAKAQSSAYLQSLFPTVFAEPVNATDADQSDLLPAWTYHNVAFFKSELAQLFKPEWMLVCHISELSKPKDYITFDGFGERALILRDRENIIRAYHNVCRHRGAKLIAGAGSNCPDILACPFHGWSYDLKGNLVAVPALATFDQFNLADNHLVTLDSEVWMGFVFIRFQSGGQSLATKLAPVADLIKPYQIERMQALAATRYQQTRPYNWKVIHDIDNEGYHVAVGHPCLQQLYGKSYTDSEIQGIAVSSATINQKPGRIWSVKNYQQLLPQFDHLPPQNQRLWRYIGLFPNTVIGLYPDSIEFYMTIPEAVNRTRYLGCSYGLPDARRQTAAARFLNRRINATTDREDEFFVMQMQQGLRSSALPEPKLSSREHGVRRFHKAIQRKIPSANFKHPMVNH